MKTPEMIPGDMITMIEAGLHTRLWKGVGPSRMYAGGVLGHEICIVIARTKESLDDRTFWFCILTSSQIVGWTNRANKFRYTDVE